MLDVRTDEAIRAAIHTVRRSRHSERVRAYSQAQGMRRGSRDGGRRPAPGAGGYLGRAVHRRPRHRQPRPHGRQLCPWAGRRLVSGEAEPLTFTLARPKGRYEGPPELKRFARKLFKLAGAWSGTWAARRTSSGPSPDGKLYLLQSRPITTLLGFDPVTGEFNDSLTGDYVWSCVNLGEAVSVVMTPFTWSVMRMGFERAERLARTLLGRQHRRPPLSEHHRDGLCLAALGKNRGRRQRDGRRARRVPGERWITT